MSDFSGLYAATFDWVKDAASSFAPWGDAWRLLPAELWVDRIYEGYYDEELES